MRRTAFLLTLACLAGLAGLAGCLNSNEPRPISVSVTVEPAVPRAGTQVVFTVSAQGESLNNVMLAFGNGLSEEFPVAAARSVMVTFHHTYAGAGSYPVTATATDDRSGSKSVTLNLVVQ